MSPQGVVVLFTGLPAAGKSTLAEGFAEFLEEVTSRPVTTLDGDVVRRVLTPDLGFSRADREANLARSGWVAAEIARHGGQVVMSSIAPFDGSRRALRAAVIEAGAAFILVHVSTPLESCQARDPKGLYRAAQQGRLPELTGVSSPYEEPTDAEVVVNTADLSVAAALATVIEQIHRCGVP